MFHVSEVVGSVFFLCVFGDEHSEGIKIRWGYGWIAV